MRTWAVKRAEEVLERVFAVMDIEENFYFYLLQAMEELKTVMGYMQRIEDGFVYVDESDTILNSADDYIVKFRLQEEVTEEKLHELAYTVITDNFLVGIDVLEKFLAGQAASEFG